MKRNAASLANVAHRLRFDGAGYLIGRSNFATLLGDTADQDFGTLRTAGISGRPLGNDEFIAGLERILGRRIARRAPGRKPKSDDKQIELL